MSNLGKCTKFKGTTVWVMSTTKSGEKQVMSVQIVVDGGKENVAMSYAECQRFNLPTYTCLSL